MERNTHTVMSMLKIGDRFHKTNDKKKIVYTKVEGEKKVTYFQTYRHFGQRDGVRFPEPFKSTTPVTFLRHTEPHANEKSQNN